MDSSTWAISVIRMTRAEPPGKASTDSDRRATYGASLQQFDELLDAAGASGHASRPLPLFYALSQAGRAIAAAHSETWRVRSHGLAEDRSAAGDDPLLRRVQRRARGDDAFSSVCAALNVPDPFGSSGIEIGAAWAALPSLNGFLPHWAEEWYPVLQAFNDGLPDADRVMKLHAPSHAPRPRDGLPATAYPSVPAGFEFEPAEYPEIPLDPTTFRLGAVRWGPARTTPSVFDVTHSDTRERERWLLPAPPGSDQPFVPLTAWWVLLFGLSIFARYDPGLWSASLNLDSSDRAVPLRLLLDDALESVPDLIAEALISAGEDGDDAQ